MEDSIRHYDYARNEPARLEKLNPTLAKPSHRHKGHVAVSGTTPNLSNRQP